MQPGAPGVIPASICSRENTGGPSSFSVLSAHYVKNKSPLYGQPCLYLGLLPITSSHKTSSQFLLQEPRGWRGHCRGQHRTGDGPEGWMGFMRVHLWKCQVH